MNYNYLNRTTDIVGKVEKRPKFVVKETLFQSPTNLGKLLLRFIIINS